ncbi:MAG: hypothetical protein OXI96_08790 [Acidimicrobiaceae bacterium]|nr:hypothetical protein [Acidimicrobiaceae bacterium]
MRVVATTEFQAKAEQLITERETLRIDHQGTPIGFYVPIAAKDRRAGREALGRLGSLVEEVLEQTGLTEDELVAEVERTSIELETPDS